MWSLVVALIRSLLSELNQNYLKTTLDLFGELDDSLLEEGKGVANLEILDFFANLIKGFHLQAETHQNGLVYVSQIQMLAESTREVEFGNGGDKIKH